MLILSQIIIGIFIVLITKFLLKKQDVSIGIIIAIISNGLSVLFSIIILNVEIIYGVNQSISFILQYLLQTFLIALLISGFMRIINNNTTTVYNNSKNKCKEFLYVISAAIIGGLSAILIFIPKWFANTFGEIPADHFIFLITQGNGESTKAQDLQLLNQIFVPVVIIIVLSSLVGLISSKLILKKESINKKNNKEVKIDIRVFAFIILFLMLLSSLIYAFNAIPLRDIIKLQFEKSSYLEDNFVMPNKQNIRLPEKKRNLIHIYMESVENSFYSKDLGGYDDYNLMPDLEKLSQMGISFSHTDKHGGPQQTYASGHSIAAMVNMNSGVPMLAAGARNGSTLSYPNFPTIGDILKENGYETQFILGSDSNWGGLGKYYRKHGDFKIFDLQYAKDQKLIPENYKVWWGFEDDKLYEYAKDEMTKLGNLDNPFYLIIENADTHFPDGYVSVNMKEKPFDKQYANVIHYSQKEIVKLIEWIQQQEWYKDTTVIVTGDHRSMDKKFFEDWDGDYNRTIVNLFLNTVHDDKEIPKEITNNRLYAPFDMFPTIMSAIGAKIEGNRLGLGVDLFTGQKTLLEKDGFQKVEIELSKRSEFYDKHRENWSEKQSDDDIYK